MDTISSIFLVLILSIFCLFAFYLFFAVLMKIDEWNNKKREEEEMKRQNRLLYNLQEKLEQIRDLSNQLTTERERINKLEKRRKN